MFQIRSNIGSACAVRAILPLLFLFFVPFAQAQINTPEFGVTVTSQNLRVCGNVGKLTTARILSKEDSATDFEIAFDLPDGITYDPGTVAITSQGGSSDFSISELDISNLNTPVFGLQRPANAPWQINDEVFFTFEKSASCEAVQFSYNGGIFKDAHAIGFTDSDGPKTYTDNDVTVNSYDLRRAFLNVIDYNTIQAAPSENASRPLTIVNSGNGAIGSFTHVVTVGSTLDDNYSLSFNGSTLTPVSIGGGVYTYVIDLGTAPFLGAVGDGDGLFENEDILLTEQFVTEACGTDQISHQPKWGCQAGIFCQELDPVTAQVHTGSLIGSYTVLEVGGPVVPDLALTSTYTVEIENTSSTLNAYDFHVNIGLGDYDPIRTSISQNDLWGSDFRNNRLLSNFRLGATTFTPQRYANTERTYDTGLGSYYIPGDFFSTDPDGAGGFDDLDGDGFFDDLAPNATTRISFDMDVSLLPPAACGSYGELLKYEHLHIDVFSVDQCGQSGSTVREDVHQSGIDSNALKVEAPTDIISGQSFDLTFDGNLNVYYEEAPDCNGIPLLSDDPSTVFTIDLTVPNGVSLFGTPAGFSQTGNQITYTTDQLDQPDGDFQFDFAIPFPLVVDCTVYTGPRELNVDYTIMYSSACFSRDIYCGTESLYTHCIAPCSGATTTSFSAERVTPGWTDASQATNVVLDAATHALDTYMAKDEMRVQTSVVMNSLSSNELFLQITYDTNNHLSGVADIIQFDRGTITINDLSSGIQTTALTVAPVLTSVSGTSHVLTFDLSSYRSIISPTYAYGEGLEADEVDLDLYFFFSSNFNGSTARFHEMTNFRGTFYTLDGTGDPLVCDDFGSKAFFFKPYVAVGNENVESLNGCVTASLTVPFDIVSGVTDLFPDEFRPPANWESIELELPTGPEFLNFAEANGYGFLQPEGEYPNTNNGGLDLSVSGSTITISRGARFEDFDQDGNRYPNFNFYVKGTPATPSVSTFSATLNYREYASASVPEDKSEVFVNTIDFDQPHFILSSPNPVEIGNSAVESFIFDICLSSTDGIEYNWLKIDPGSGFHISNIYEIVGGSETPLPFNTVNSNLYVEIGQIVAGNPMCKRFRFEGTYSECQDLTLTVENSWSCDGYPSDFESATYLNPFVFTLEPAEAAIQLLVLDQPSNTVDTCTDFRIELELRNAGSGDLIDPIISFDIPGNASGLQISDITIEYPQNSGTIESVTPTLNGNMVSVDVSQHSAINAQGGIRGSNSSMGIEEQIATIGLVLNPQCSFVSNTGSTYEVSGNNPCMGPALGSGSRLATNPIILTGAEPPYSTNNGIQVSNSGLLSGCGTETVSFETTIVGGTTGTMDFARIVLPENVSYVDGSFGSTGTFLASFESRATNGANEVITVRLPQGASNGDMIHYTLAIENAPTACSGNGTIGLATYLTTNSLSCGGVACGETEIETGNGAQDISQEKTQIRQSSVVPSATYIRNTSDTTYSLNFGLENIGLLDLDAGSAYEVFCTDTGGNPTGPSIYSGTLAQPVAAGSAITERVTFSTTSFCGDNEDIVVVFTPSANNCHCNVLSILIPTTEINPTDADLTLDKTADKTQATVGEEVVFTITIGNEGPAEATNIEVTDLLPDGFGYVSSSASTGTYDSVSGIWNIASLSNGASETLDLRTTVLGGTTNYTNTATITGADQSDPDGSDNEDSVTIDVSEHADLVIGKTADKTQAAIGEEVVFTLTISNSGPAEATNIVVTDLLPDGFGYVSSSSSMGTYDPLTGAWALAALANGALETLEIRTVVLEGATSYTNTATITGADQHDPDDSDNEASITIDIRDDSCLVIFNEFSPNNDGANEFFYIECIEDYPNNFLQIFNRWGNLVFETEGYKNDWEGTSYGRATINSSEKLPVGTYYYILELRDGSGSVKTGWLYITR